ncbi:hypothetical protein O3M35_002369 [Rhynocoris fuscipes]|uniref:ABC transporter domain-containing protein n=1 Tax=Rhynocoris fuscipes TaxID=488301 RepID=A0AAW1CLN2_9HEMI
MANREGGEMMISVREAYKVLGSHQVLKGLNMSVSSNNIYGLLGPSGCGKTVLLNCILGMRNLDDGVIRLGVTDRKLVGYMPQEVALFKEFTIKEIFIFYGRLFGISRQLIHNRYNDYTTILGLPHWHSTIQSLSGGEQRRVSFAVTLLHDPVLLILDEPTVGVDSILSQRIWKYLVELSSQGKTIVITTHYVEEARHAHTIALMRAGQILREDRPDNIMSSVGVSSLEEAFLELSKKQDEGSEYMPIFRNRSIGKESGSPLNNDNRFNINRFIAQLIKNLLWMKRNTLIMSFLLLLPAMQSFFFCISFGQNPQNLNLIIYSEEIKGDGDQCANIDVKQRLYDCDSQSLEIPDVPLTCHFIAHLNKSMHISLESSMESARLNVLRNKAWGVIYLQSNFSLATIQRINEFIPTDNDTVDSSFAYITMDMSNYVVANYLRKQIIDAYIELKRALSENCNISDRVSSIPLKFETPIYGTNNPVYAYSGLPGFFCSFCFYFTMIFTSGAIMMEKLVGLLDRSLVAGMNYIEIVGAHIVVQFLLISVQKSIMLIIFYICFDNPLIGSVPLIILLLYCIEAVGVSYGFLLTEIFSSDRLVSYAGIGATLAVFSLGGIIWPMEGADILIRSWIWAFPVAPAIDSYRAIALKGFSLDHVQVYAGFLSSIIWTLLFSAISVVLVKSKRLQ